MINEEARFILGAYRPSGLDVGDPQMAEAIRQTHNDPVLEAWFKREIEFDAELARQLKSIPVPQNLRANILSGLKISTLPAAGKATWYFGKWMAIAALVLLFASLGGLWLRPSSSPLSGWQTGALDTLSSVVEGRAQLDATSPDAAILQAWLRDRKAPSPEISPVSLRSLASLGCKAITWNHKTVSIICFNLGNGALVHLVVIDRSDLPDSPPVGQPRFASKNGWITASWSEGGNAMMLVTKGDRKDIERFFL